MSMDVRPGYVNPLTMMKKNEATSAMGRQKSKSNDVQDLQIKRQSLQNRMLLLKSTTSGASAESQKEIEKRLEDISSELKSAQTLEAKGINDGNADASGAKAKEKYDVYEQGKTEAQSPGLYQATQNKEKGISLSFLPYSE